MSKVIGHFFLEDLHIDLLNKQWKIVILEKKKNCIPPLVLKATPTKGLTSWTWVDNDVSNWFPTLKNFYRSPVSKWPPQYRKNSTLSNFNAIWYLGRLWCPELIPDVQKFLTVAIFKMANTTAHKFNIVRFQR
jgi:hypothetical protein